MSQITEDLKDIVIKFVGDSGDGMQLTGTQFSNNTALAGNDLSTFPDYPAEIRAPLGTVAGVSGFQIHFSSEKIYGPGDTCDVLVAMNAAALKSNLLFLKKGGIIIANESGFDSKNLRLAQINEEDNPLKNNSLDNYIVYKIDVTKNTREALKEYSLGTKEKDRAKNMYVLGIVYWLYNRTLDMTIQFLEEKFQNKNEILNSNIDALKAGYNFGETTEIFNARYTVKKAKLEKGSYRSITGNTALAYGIIASTELSKTSAFLGTYPITPASDILHELSKYKNFNVITFQAEDEIAGICAAIGASYGGKLGYTTTSGPGMALKTEAIGLATILEIPLIIINVQRGGPSTGLPTKTEQSDLLQAMYGRNGDAQIPVIAAFSPSDCFDTVIEATRIAVEHMTPVIMLSDGYIANGSEPWKYPQSKDLKSIKISYLKEKNDTNVLPYLRNENFVRPWIIPGTKGMEYRIGGLEKENITGNVSYSPQNHELMTNLRADKIKKIADFIPHQNFSEGSEDDDYLVISWGGTYGVVKSSVIELRNKGHKVAHVHIKYINPFPKNLETILNKFQKVIVPELNNGQLIKLLGQEFKNDFIGINKVQGLPFFKLELEEKIKTVLEN